MEKSLIDNSHHVMTLRSVIDKKLTPLIDGDYVLWDLPYHKNIGDTFIWQGERAFLESTGFNQIDFGSSDTANLCDYDKSVIICLQGGGNFGDIYRSSQDFRNKVIEKYKNNKIIIFPQSIHYDCANYLSQDKAVIDEHPNLYICLRDTFSYNLAANHFVNAKLLLVPDMAFYIDPNEYVKYMLNGTKTLFLKRNDNELANLDYDKLLQDINSPDVLDWPNFNKSFLKDNVFFISSRLTGRCKVKWLHKIMSNLVNNYAFNSNREYLLEMGLIFISQYKEVYTTRLHAFILSFLLNKKVYLLDNKHRKLNNFCDTWLSDCESIEII